MPSNGDIRFHDIGMRIPAKFIADSTQSSEDFWVFEHGFYKQYILLSRADTENMTLDGYISAMREIGAECEYAEKDGMDAVISKVTNDHGEYCQELYFLYNGSRYAIALRGASDEEFADLIRTVCFDISDTAG